MQTYRSRLVGALSIGTMAIQVPGAVLFILSLTMRPGVNWTSWLPYAVTAGMQAALLVSQPSYFRMAEVERRCWKFTEAGAGSSGSVDRKKTS